MFTMLKQIYDMSGLLHITLFLNLDVKPMYHWLLFDHILQLYIHFSIHEMKSKEIMVQTG